MKKVKIVNSGCDDNTTFELLVTDAEREFIEQFCAANNKASRGGCQPTLEVIVLD